MALHVVSDPHGHRDELVRALQAARLLDAAEGWAGGTDRLWVLGDFFDRGPDGVGVVDLVRRLQGEAAAAGGQVGAVLGNHEVLALGTHRFGETRVGGHRGSSFAASWVLNGGLADDQERLTDDHLAWLAALPAVVVVDGWLLMHSDTTEYLKWGGSVDEVNEAIRAALSGGVESMWAVWSDLTDRYAFSGRHGERAAARVLAQLGGERIVHGHSIVATLQPGHPDPTATTSPLSYAGGLALAVDGGLYAGGPLLMVSLPPPPR
ncbi:MAG: metallophosphoesterase [Actinomycetota bacterium]|nr:metallophosphoesterase [Actinomycetota bacterium]